jgi:hypothetical protein
MKFTATILPLLVLVPSGTNGLKTTTAALRGASTLKEELEGTLFGGASPRHLQDDTCVDPAYRYEGNARATCCMPDMIDHDLLTHNAELMADVQYAMGPNNDDISYWYIQFDAGAAGRSLAGVDLTGWCVDCSCGLGAGTRMFDVFSTYDDWNYDNALDSPDKDSPTSTG